MRGLRILGAAYLAASMLASVVAAEQYEAGIVTAMPAVMRRQDNNDEGDNEDRRTTPRPRPTAESDEPEETGEPEPTARATRTTNNRDDEDEDEEPTGTTGRNTKTTMKPTRRPNPLDPAGGITVIKPVVTEGSLYYKFREKITFEWNMTSVRQTPTALNVEAYASDSRHYYTIAGNLSASETKAVWDTNNDMTGEFRLIQGHYALWIYDADKPRSAVASAGQLAPYAGQLRFALYSPKPAESFKDFKCIGCSAGNSLMVPKVLMATMFVFLASFMWFLGVAGAL